MVACHTVRTSDKPTPECRETLRLMPELLLPISGISRTRARAPGGGDRNRARKIQGPGNPGISPAARVQLGLLPMSYEKRQARTLYGRDEIRTCSFISVRVAVRVLLAYPVNP
jgi:hypothetical protein